MTAIREKQYQDTLLLILEEKSKLSKQNAEFDQLGNALHTYIHTYDRTVLRLYVCANTLVALDLQTRLDDKEFKANGIHTSFQQFKK